MPSRWREKQARFSFAYKLDAYGPCLRMNGLDVARSLEISKSACPRIRICFSGRSRFGELVATVDRAELSFLKELSYRLVYFLLCFSQFLGDLRERKALRRILQR